MVWCRKQKRARGHETARHTAVASTIAVLAFIAWPPGRVSPGVEVRFVRLPAVTLPQVSPQEQRCRALFLSGLSSALARPEGGRASRPLRPLKDMLAKRAEAGLRGAVLTETNRARSEFSLPVLRPSVVLDLAAAAHAQDMAARGYREHASPEGCGLFDRAVAFVGYPSGGVAENLASGQTSTQQVVAGWLASPSHRTNILHPEYLEMGLASARAKDGTLYWAQVFGDSDTTPKAFQEGLACPEGFAPVRVPATRDGVVLRPKVCASATEIAGPFPEAARAKCREAQGSLARAESMGRKTPGGAVATEVGPRIPECERPRWPRSLLPVLSQSADTLCLMGAKRDKTTGACIERDVAFGPFHPALRAVCEATETGASLQACSRDTWPADTLRRVWKRGGF